MGGRDLAGQNFWKSAVAIGEKYGTAEEYLVQEEILLIFAGEPQIWCGNTRIQLSDIPEERGVGWEEIWNGGRPRNRALSSERICDQNVDWDCVSSFCFSYKNSLPPSLLDKKIEQPFSTKVRPLPFQYPLLPFFNTGIFYWCEFIEGYLPGE